jgi:ABC-type spermidine/putrescine transport system permease subunit I
MALRKVVLPEIIPGVLSGFVLAITLSLDDYIITAFIPLSVFLALFVALLFDEGYDGSSRFSLSHALNIEYYRIWLPIAIIMMVVTFVFSFEPIRKFIKGRFSFNKSKE